MSSGDVPPLVRRLALPFITAFGFGLREFRIGAYNLDLDEYTTYFFATEPVSRIFSSDYYAETNPPLYYLLQRAWLTFGDGEGHLRMLPVLLGTACIPVVYLLGSRTLGFGTGLVAALLLATSPLHVEFSRIIRTYSLQSLGTLICALLLVEILRSYGLQLGSEVRARAEGRSRWLLWTGYAVANACLLYMHNTSVLFPVLTGALVVYFLARRLLPLSFLTPWVIAHLVTLVIAAPWLRVIALQSGSVMSNFWIPETTPAWAYAQFMSLYPVAKLLKPLVWGLLAWGCWCMRRTPHLLALVLVFFAGQPLLLLLASLFQPVLILRAMVWSTAFMTIPLAVGLLAVRPWLRERGVVAAVAIVSAIHLNVVLKNYPSEPRKNPMAALLEPLEQFRRGEDELIVGPEVTAWTLWYEARRMGLARRGLGLTFGDTQPQLKQWLGVTPVKRTEVVSRLSGSRAWLLYLRDHAPFPLAEADDFDEVIETLNAWGHLTGSWSSRQYALLLFESRGASGLKTATFDGLPP